MVYIECITQAAKIEKSQCHNERQLKGEGGEGEADTALIIKACLCHNTVTKGERERERERISVVMEHPFLCK